jgi:hypothetical protein
MQQSLSGRGEVSEHLRQIPKGAWLREDIDRAELTRSVSRFGLCVSREDHYWQVRKSASDARENREAIESGHDEIKEDAIDRRSLNDIERFNSVEGHENIMPFDSQNLGEHLGNGRIVFDNQYAHKCPRGGSIRAEGSARQDLTFGTVHAF